jgi:hypothetical protein
MKQKQKTRSMGRAFLQEVFAIPWSLNWLRQTRIEDRAVAECLSLCNDPVPVDRHGMQTAKRLRRFFTQTGDRSDQARTQEGPSLTSIPCASRGSNW